MRCLPNYKKLWISNFHQFIDKNSQSEGQETEKKQHCTQLLKGIPQSTSCCIDKMLKDYFVDGLVQIAIVLSLLRTDLNNYMNIHYVNYPEVQEIILGSSAALAPTNFINNNINSFYGSGNPKSIYSDLTYQNLIQDLRSLRRFSVWQRSHSAQQIETFLVGLNNLPEIARAPAVEQNNNNNVQSETNTDDQSDVESSNNNQNLDSNDNVQYEEVVLGVDSTCSTSSSVSSSVNSQYDFQFDGLSREV